MNRQRILIGVISFLLLGGVIAFDLTVPTHLGSLLVLALIGTLAQAEIYGLFRRMGLDAIPSLGVPAALMLFLWRGVGPFFGLTDGEVRAVLGFLLAAIVVAPFVAAMLRSGPHHPGGRDEFERAAVTITGLMLVWFLLSFLLELRMIRGASGTTLPGLELAIVLVVSMKVADTAAYFVGRSIGSTPLTWVSPKKTWEGSAASAIGAVAVSLLGGLLFGFVWWHMILFGLLTNVAGQVGDLLESLIKRRSGVKDSGTFLREAGGFLDLVDSLLLAAPVGYLFARLVIL